MKAKYTYLIVALCYALSLLLPFAASYDSVSITSSIYSPDDSDASPLTFTEAVPICTPYGIVWMKAGEGNPPASHSGAVCGLCVVASIQLDDLKEASSIAVALPDLYSSKHNNTTLNHHVASLALLQLHNKAPPKTIA